jgi:hypothetical protein
LTSLEHVPANPPTSTSKWTYEVEYTDSNGIGWIAGGGIELILAKGKLVRPRHNSQIQIVLERKYNALTHISIDRVASYRLDNAPGGALVLNDLDEMLTAVRNGLPGSTLAMAGKGLEGFLRLKGKAERWWKTRYEGLTVGKLLGEPEVEEIVRRRIGEGYWGKLRGSAVFVRNQGVHNNQAPVTGAEAVTPV